MSNYYNEHIRNVILQELSDLRLKTKMFKEGKYGEDEITNEENFIDDLIYSANVIEKRLKEMKLPVKQEFIETPEGRTAY